MIQNKLIAPVLVKIDHHFLLLKRAKIKRGTPNYLPEFWDIPGGSVEPGETPRKAAERETFEETGLHVIVEDIIHEDSTYDFTKKIVFTRLVHIGSVLTNQPIKLDPEEHTAYKLVDTFCGQERLVDYLYSIFEQNQKFFR